MTPRQVTPPPDCRISELLSVPVPHKFDRHRRDAVFGKSVLITGAAGSVGSALARQVAAGDAKRLTLLDTNESGLFELAVELESERGSSKPRLEVAVGSVTSGPRLARLFARAQPSHVIHPAAADLGSRDELTAELFSLLQPEQHSQPASAWSPAASQATNQELRTQP